MMPTDYEGLLRVLVDHRIQFILVGGAAGRPKDLEPLAELQALLLERESKPNGAKT